MINWPSNSSNLSNIYLLAIQTKRKIWQGKKKEREKEREKSLHREKGRKEADEA